jgi:hypothetical protein
MLGLGFRKPPQENRIKSAYHNRSGQKTSGIRARISLTVAANLESVGLTERLNKEKCKSRPLKQGPREKTKGI